MSEENPAPAVPATTPEAATSTVPRFTPPNLHEIITGRLKSNLAEARGMYGLGDTKLDPKGIALIAAGIRAAQREVEDWAKQLDPSIFLTDAATQQAGEDKIAALRARLRVPDTATVADVVAAVLQGAWKRMGIILCPLNRPIEPWVHWAHLALVKRMPWLGYDQVSFPSIVYARNKLAQQFLSTEAEWSFWLDGDTVCPLGDANTFYHRFGANPGFAKPEFMGVQAFEKMASRQKTIIGAVVADRHPGNRLIIQPDLNPRTDADRQLVKLLKKEGPQDKAVQVPYIGTGCALVHRSVYDDIMKKFPERGPLTAGEPFNFFGGGGGMDAQGEDIAFCKLAADAGHPAFLDLSVWCAHLGTHSFFPQPQL